MEVVIRIPNIPLVGNLSSFEVQCVVLEPSPVRGYARPHHHVSQQPIIKDHPHNATLTPRCPPLSPLPWSPMLHIACSPHHLLPSFPASCNPCHLLSSFPAPPGDGCMPFVTHTYPSSPTLIFPSHSNTTSSTSDSYRLSTSHTLDTQVQQSRTRPPTPPLLDAA